MASSRASSRFRPPPALLAAVWPLVRGKLAEVEEEIRANLRSPWGPIDRAGNYLAEAGGKRIRPILVLLTSGLLGYRGRDDVLVGAVFELIHTATLVHDDIIDEAETRRGRPAANRVFGNEFTVLLGDYLYIRSMNMVLRAGKLRLIEILAEATERMIEGEMLAHDLRGSTEVTAEQHLAIVERKTAWLFSGCCRAAAVLAGVDRETEDALARYGMSLGVAFQLADDLLDLVASEETLGKPVAADLREGRLTLPWIDLWERGSDRDREEIRAVVEEGRFRPGSWLRLRRALEENGCIDRCRELARQRALEAREIIRGFPRGAYRAVLEELPRTVIDRDR